MTTTMREDSVLHTIKEGNVQKPYKEQVITVQKFEEMLTRTDPLSVHSEATSEPDTDYSEAASDAENSVAKSEEVKTIKTVVTKRTLSIKDKKRQTAMTLQWLEENYCTCEGVCLPRKVVYNHYLDFCRQESLEPACAATFGKVNKKDSIPYSVHFPNFSPADNQTEVPTRYYKASGHTWTFNVPLLWHWDTRDKPVLPFCVLWERPDPGGFTRKYSLCSKTGTLLPEFPRAALLILPDNQNRDRMDTFLMMYKTHCQCILDTTILGNFKEIETYLLHFWQGLPEHLLPTMTNDLTIDIICICDSILHKTLIDVLIPSTMQEMPESLLKDTLNFAQYWERWVTSALEGLPQRLIEKKVSVARRFSQSLKRQSSFLHLAQTARPVLFDAQLVNQMISDLDLIDLNTIGSQAMCGSLEPGAESDSSLNAEYLREFKELLRKQATIEAFIEWLDTNVEQKIIKPSKQSGKNLQRKGQDFLLKWSFFGARISHNLTLNNAKSFASIHLIRLLLDEYMLLAVESQLQNDKDRELQHILDKHSRPDEHGCRPTLSSTPGSIFLANPARCTPKSPATQAPFALKREQNAMYIDSAYGVAYNESYGQTEHPLGHLDALTRTMPQSNSMLTPPMSPIVPTNRSNCWLSNSGSLIPSTHSYYFDNNTWNNATTHNHIRPNYSSKTEHYDGYHYAGYESISAEYHCTSGYHNYYQTDLSHTEMYVKSNADFVPVIHKHTSMNNSFHGNEMDMNIYERPSNKNSSAESSPSQGSSSSRPSMLQEAFTYPAMSSHELADFGAACNDMNQAQSVTYMF